MDVWQAYMQQQQALYAQQLALMYQQYQLPAFDAAPFQFVPLAMAQPDIAFAQPHQPEQQIAYQAPQSLATM